VVALCGVHNPLESTTQPDDRAYFEQARAIADAWNRGEYPDLSRKGSPPYLGTLHTGYQRVLASVFFIAGDNPSAGVGLNVLSAAFLPLLLFAAIHGLKSMEQEGSATEGLSQRSARTAALLAAVYPSTGYWSSWILKDVLLATMFVAALALVIDSVRLKRPGLAAGALMATGFLLVLRAYAALALLAGVAAYALSLMPRRVVLQAACGIAVIAIATSYTATGGDYMSQLVHSLSLQLPDSATTVASSVQYFLSSVPRMLLAPYAWVKAFGPNPQYGLYPGMWFLYLIVYPLAICGFWGAVRTNNLPCAIPLGAWCASALILVIAYGGDAPRQRLYLDMIAIGFAGLGITTSGKRLVFAAWFLGLISFAVVQLVSLQIRY
jgi:hypothetical protein